MKKKAKVYHINIHFLTEVKDLDNYNVDVIVHLNGQNYVATFVTFKNFMHLIEIYKKTGEFLSGKYNYSVSTVYIENLTKELIEKTVIDMLENGGFHRIFELCEKEENE